FQRRDLDVDEAAFRADDESYRLAGIARTLFARARMRDEAARPAGDRRQLVLDERAEEPARLDRWQDRIARLFESEDRLRAQVFGRESRRAPVALFDAPG